MPKPLITLVALVAVLLVYFIGFRMYQIRKRKKEKTYTDPAKLLPRKIALSFSVPAKLFGEKWDALATEFLENDGRIVEGNDGAFIVYLGDSSKSKFEGMIDTPASEMPVRIILSPQKENLEVRIDEDFGFQMFLGPAKAAYQDKYQVRFDMLENLIRLELES